MYGLMFECVYKCATEMLEPLGRPALIGECLIYLDVSVEPVLSRKLFSAVRDGTFERAFTGMNTKVVVNLVALGKRALVTCAVLPHAFVSGFARLKCQSEQVSSEYRGTST